MRGRYCSDCRRILLVTEQQDTLLSLFLRGRTSILLAACLPGTAFDQGLSLFAVHRAEHASRWEEGQCTAPAKTKLNLISGQVYQRRQSGAELCGH
jgi:hypothetical protein